MRGTRVMQRDLLAALLTSVVLAVSLSSCNEDLVATPSSPTPSTLVATATPTPTPTPTQSSKPAPPTIPPAATSGLTVTSAGAFARFYLAATDHLVATGDATLVRRWALPQCVACRAFADEYEKIYQAGGGITGSTQTQVTKVLSV